MPLTFPKWRARSRIFCNCEVIFTGTITPVLLAVFRGLNRTPSSLTSLHLSASKSPIRRPVTTARSIRQTIIRPLGVGLSSLPHNAAARTRANSSSVMYLCRFGSGTPCISRQGLSSRSPLRTAKLKTRDRSALYLLAAFGLSIKLSSTKAAMCIGRTCSMSNSANALEAMSVIRIYSFRVFNAYLESASFFHRSSSLTIVLSGASTSANRSAYRFSACAYSSSSVFPSTPRTRPNRIALLRRNPIGLSKKYEPCLSIIRVGKCFPFFRGRFMQSSSQVVAAVNAFSELGFEYGIQGSAAGRRLLFHLCVYGQVRQASRTLSFVWQAVYSPLRQRFHAQSWLSYSFACPSAFQSEK